MDRRVAVRDVRAGDLVVAVVLAKAAARRVEGGGGIAPLCQPADRLVVRIGVVDGDVERVARVEGLALHVQRIAGVLDREQHVARKELDVVEPRDLLIALVEEREPANVCRRVLLHELEDRRPAARAARARLRVAVFGAGGVGVAGLVEVELAETDARAEDPVLRPLEGRAVRGLCQHVRVEWRGAVDGRVVDGHPLRVECLSVRSQLDLIRRWERGLRLEGDRLPGSVQDLEHLQLPIVEIAGLARHVAIDEAVRHSRGDRSWLYRTPDVLDDPDVPGRVVLDALVAAPAQRAGDILDRGRIARGRRIRRRARVLSGEQQPLRERVPGRAVDGRERRAGVVMSRHQRYAVPGIGVEVDPGEVSLLLARGVGRRVLVPLEEEVGAVVVAIVGALLVLEHEIGVLVRLRLLRLGRRNEAGNHLWHRRVVRARRVVLVTVPADDPLRILKPHRALRHHGLAQLRRELRCRRVASRLGFRLRNIRKRRSGRA